MDRLGAQLAGLREIDPFENVERLQEHRSLIPRAGLVHIVAVEVRRHRLLDLAAIGRQILVREDAAGGLVGIRDAVRDVAFIERVAAGANRGDAIVTLRERRFLSGDDRAERLREVRLAEHFAHVGNVSVRVIRLRRPFVLLRRLALAHEEVAEELIHGEAVGELDRRLHHLFEPHRSLGLERDRHRVDHRGNRRAERPVAGNEALRLEQIGRCGFWRRTLAVDDDDLFGLRVVDHRRRFAAEAEMRDLADRRREHRGDPRVDRVAALLKYLDAGGDRIVTPGGDDAVRAADLRTHRLAVRRDARRLRRSGFRLLRRQRRRRNHDGSANPQSAIRPSTNSGRPEPAEGRVPQCGHGG